MPQRPDDRKELHIHFDSEADGFFWGQERKIKSTKAMEGTVQKFGFSDYNRPRRELIGLALFFGSGGLIHQQNSMLRNGFR